jgi:hypothetical protein
VKRDYGSCAALVHACIAALQLMLLHRHLMKSDERVDRSATPHTLLALHASMHALHPAPAGCGASSSLLAPPAPYAPAAAEAKQLLHAYLDVHASRCIAHFNDGRLSGN